MFGLQSIIPCVVFLPCVCCVLVATTTWRIFLDSRVLWASKNGPSTRNLLVLSSAVVAFAAARCSFAGRARCPAVIVIGFGCFWVDDGDGDADACCLQKRALSGPGSAEKDKKQKKILGMGRYVIFQYVSSHNPNLSLVSLALKII